MRMHTVVFEHVKVRDLPTARQAKLGSQLHEGFSKVTVRIEQEVVADAPSDKAQADLPALMVNPMFGMWAERKDMADVGA